MVTDKDGVYIVSDIQRMPDEHKYDAEMLDACDLDPGDFDVVITSRREKMLRQYLEKSDIKLQNRHEKWKKMCGKNSYASVLSNS